MPEKGPWQLTLEQEPEAQGALLALDPHNGLIKVMVGGYDFRTSQFNRVLQARRLPGSAMKPLIYAAALDKGYTPATVILDTPLIFKERLETGEIKEWKPKNYSKRFYGPIPLRTALAKSYNVITIKILEDIGVRYAADYARKLGIDSHLDEDLTLGLGSSALTPLELARRYAVLANGGVRVMPTYINKVLDRDGKVIESIDPADFPEGPAGGSAADRPVPQPGHQRRNRLSDHQPDGERGPAGHRLARQGPEAAGRRQNRHHQRSQGRLVRRLCPATARRRLGRLRPGAASGQRGNRLPGRGTGLGRLHGESQPRTCRSSSSRYRTASSSGRSIR